MSFTTQPPQPSSPQQCSSGLFSSACEHNGTIFAHAGIEPGLDEVYEDDGIRAVMRRDRVTPEMLRQIVANTRRRLAQSAR
jgi:hypothetical protein